MLGWVCDVGLGLRCGVVCVVLERVCGVGLGKWLDVRWGVQSCVRFGVWCWVRCVLELGVGRVLLGWVCGVGLGE